MDSSLALLIGGTAAYAGAIAYLVSVPDLGTRRAALATAGTATAVAASFLLMIALANVAFPATVGVVALLSGVVAYLAFVRDLGRRRAALATAGAATAVTVSFLAVVYLAVIAFLAAIGVYLLLRRVQLRIGPAFILMGTTLTGLLAASALVFWVSLASM